MRSLFVLLAVVVMAAGCGDSGEPATSLPGAPPTTTAPPTSTASGPCPAEPFSGTIERTVEAETSNGTHVVAARRDAELVSAYAYDFGTGDTYTIYVGDHQIDEAGVGSDTLVAPAGGMLATIFLISDTEMGSESNLSLTFVPIVDTGGGAEISGFGADDVQGSVTILAITEDEICFEIGTVDPQQTLDGVVSAPFANS